jgi:D-lactate dehydrogenase
MSNIIFFEVDEWETEHIKQVFSGAPLLLTANKVQDETNPDFFTAEIISTFIYSELNRQTLEKFPNLKFIATRSTGYDHIDLNYCKEKGIVVANVPSYGAHSVAEQTFALILAISRKIVDAVNRSRKGDFSFEGLRGFDLAGKTLGVIGAGKIGQHVIDLGLCFGMNVLVHTGHPGENKERLTYVSLDDLLGQSDIVTLHVPYTKETHHTINRENIKKFKKGSILINTARGALVETLAILEGLETEILQAVGLDVLEEENDLKEERELLTDDYFNTHDIKTELIDHILLNREDVFYTSHNAFNTVEALGQIIHTTADNIKAFSENRQENVVTAE